MDKLSEKITVMLNSGQSAIDISEYFGGIIPMLKKCKQDPQLIRLLQKNYHINFQDYNGIITEKNTYFPWNLDKFTKKIKKVSGNKKLESLSS